MLFDFVKCPALGFMPARHLLFRQDRFQRGHGEGPIHSRRMEQCRQPRFVDHPAVAMQRLAVEQLIQVRDNLGFGDSPGDAVDFFLVVVPVIPARRGQYQGTILGIVVQRDADFNGIACVAEAPTSIMMGLSSLRIRVVRRSLTEQVSTPTGDAGKTCSGASGNAVLGNHFLIEHDAQTRLVCDGGEPVLDDGAVQPHLLPDRIAVRIGKAFEISAVRNRRE